MAKNFTRYGLLLMTFLCAVAAINEIYMPGGSRWILLGFSILFGVSLVTLLKIEGVID